jgi:serine/threonine protein kinase
VLARGADGVRAVITDFGLARLDPTASVNEGRTLAEVRLAGTVAYMSPEQLRGDRITAASDIYSFGVVLFEMATGTLPFDDRDLIKAAMLKASGEPIPVRTRVPDIDHRWEVAIDRCLEKDPERRFASADALAAWVHGPPLVRVLTVDPARLGSRDCSDDPRAHGEHRRLDVVDAPVSATPRSAGCVRRRRGRVALNDL